MQGSGGQVAADRIEDGSGIIARLVLAGKQQGLHTGTAQVQQLLRDVVFVDAKAFQHASRDAIMLAQHAQQQVFQTYRLYLPGQSLLLRPRQRSPCRRRQYGVIQKRLVAATEDKIQRLDHTLRADMQGREESFNQWIPQFQQTQQQVFRIDGPVSQPLRLLTSARQHLPQLIGIAIVLILLVLSAHYTYPSSQILLFSMR